MLGRPAEQSHMLETPTHSTLPSFWLENVAEPRVNADYLLDCSGILMFPSTGQIAHSRKRKKKTPTRRCLLVRQSKWGVDVDEKESLCSLGQVHIFKRLTRNEKQSQASLSNTQNNLHHVFWSISKFFPNTSWPVPPLCGGFLEANLSVPHTEN